MNIKGFVYRLSQYCHLDTKREVSTAFCRSSSGNSVLLLSTTICTNMVVSDLCITSLAQGWWFCLIQRIVGIFRGGNSNCSFWSPLWLQSLFLYKDRDIKENALIFKKIVLTHCMKNA